MCDEKGQEIDGDQLMALIATSWHAQGRLRGDGIVATVMSNKGLELYLAERGIAMHRTRVGDRYVVEKMRQDGFNVGGEQSGHIVLSDFATTGDGLIAALQVLAVIAESSRPASQACRLFTPLPQKLESVRSIGGAAVLEKPPVKKAIAAAEKELGEKGHLVIRPSGTEPVIRVMAQGENEDLVEDAVRRIVEAVRSVEAA